MRKTILILIILLSSPVFLTIVWLPSLQHQFPQGITNGELESKADFSVEYSQNRNAPSFVYHLRQFGSPGDWPYRSSFSKSVGAVLMNATGDYVYSLINLTSTNYTIVVYNNSAPRIDYYSWTGSYQGSLNVSGLLLGGIVPGNYLSQTDNLSEFFFATYSAPTITISMAYRDQSNLPNSYIDLVLVKLNSDNYSNFIYGAQLDNDSVYEMALYLYNGSIFFYDYDVQLGKLSLVKRVFVDSDADSSILFVSDFDGDGLDEFIAVARNTTATRIYFLENSNSDVYVASEWGLPSSSSKISIGDFDGDGELDFSYIYMESTVNANITAVNPYTGNVFSGVYNLSDSSSIRVELNTFHAIEMDGDGKDDLLMCVKTVDGSFNSWYDVLSLNGTKTSVQRLQRSGIETHCIVGDFDLVMGNEILLARGVSSISVEVRYSNYTLMNNMTYGDIQGSLFGVLRLDNYYGKLLFYNDTSKQLFILRRNSTNFHATINEPTITGLVIWKNNSINIAWTMALKGELKSISLKRNRTIIYASSEPVNNTINVSLLTEGIYLFELVFNVVDVGNATLYFYVDYDVTPPKLLELTPSDEAYLNTINVTITWNATDNVRFDKAIVEVNHTIITSNGSILGEANFTASQGSYILNITLVDLAGNINQSLTRFYVDTTPPNLKLTSPTSTVYTNGTLNVSWIASDNFKIHHFEIWDNGSLIVNLGPYERNMVLDLTVEGLHNLELRAIDAAGNANSTIFKVIVDLTPPNVIIISPKNNTLCPAVIDLEFNVTDRNIEEVLVYVNESLYFTTYDVNTSERIKVQFNVSGYYQIKVVAVDKANNVVMVNIKINVDAEPVYFAILAPENNSYTNSSQVELELSYDNPRDLANTTVVRNNETIYIITSSNQTKLTITLTSGENKITVTTVDSVGNIYSKTIIVILDTEPPDLRVDYNEYTRENPANLTFTVVDNYQLEKLVIITGEYKKSIGLNANGTINSTVLLSYGNNTITIILYDKAGNILKKTLWIVYDNKAPIIDIMYPSNNTVTNANHINISIHVWDEWVDVEIIKATLNGVEIASNIENFTVTLGADGAYIIEITAVDSLGNTGKVKLMLFRDTREPIIQLVSPNNGSLVNNTVLLSLKLEEEHPYMVLIKCGNTTLVYNNTKNVNAKLLLSQEGINFINITAVDKAGNKATLSLYVTSDQTPPSIIVTPESESVMQGNALVFHINVTDNYGVKAVEITINGEYYGTLIENFSEVKIALTRLGENIIVFKAIDLVGNSKSYILTITVTKAGAGGVNLNLILTVIVPISIVIGVIIGYVRTVRREK